MPSGARSDWPVSACLDLTLHAPSTRLWAVGGVIHRSTIRRRRSLRFRSRKSGHPAANSSGGVMPVLTAMARYQLNGTLRHLDLRAAASAMGQKNFPYAGIASGPIAAAGDLNLPGAKSLTAHAKISIAPGMDHYFVNTMASYLAMMTTSNYPGLSTFIDVVVGISVVIGFIVIFQAMYTAVMERTREIGILKSMGASKLYIVNVVVRETALLALGGIILGVLVSLGARVALAHRFPLLRSEERR